MFAFLHIASGILGTVLSDRKYNRSLKQCEPYKKISSKCTKKTVTTSFTD